MVWRTLALALFLVQFQVPSTTGIRTVESICGSAAAQQSCGQCMKQNPKCAWCSQPNFGRERCFALKKLHGVCNASYIQHERAEMHLIQNQNIGTMKRNPYNNEEARTFLQPQQVRMKMKPGESLSFTLRYLNQRDSADIYALNSETTSQGVQITYSSECRGKVSATNFCNNISRAEVVSFNVTVLLRECKTNGDAVISVGVAGLREVVALYITPLCGCECEKLENQEANSPYCNARGRLVCGSCICDQRFTGDSCECELPPEMKSADELMDMCRTHPTEPICSGRGKCRCGICECSNPQINSGRFCECDDTSCPMFNSILCGGHGKCVCGSCVCDSKWAGVACECTTNTNKCVGTDGGMCSGHGSCVCNECLCDHGFSGPTCEVCDTCGGFDKAEVTPVTDQEVEGEGPEDADVDADAEADQEYNSHERDEPFFNGSPSPTDTPAFSDDLDADPGENGDTEFEPEASAATTAVAPSAGARLTVHSGAVAVALILIIASFLAQKLHLATAVVELFVPSSDLRIMN